MSPVALSLSWRSLTVALLVSLSAAADSESTPLAKNSSAASPSSEPIPFPGESLPTQDYSVSSQTSDTTPSGSDPVSSPLIDSDSPPQRDTTSPLSHSVGSPPKNSVPSSQKDPVPSSPKDSVPSPPSDSVPSPLNDVAGYVNVDEMGTLLLYTSCFPRFQDTFQSMLVNAGDSFARCSPYDTSISLLQATFAMIVGLNEQVTSVPLALCVLHGQGLVDSSGVPRQTRWMSLLAQFGSKLAASTVKRCVSEAQALPFVFLSCVKSALLRECVNMTVAEPAQDVVSVVKRKVQKELVELHKLRGKRDRARVAQLSTHVTIMVYRAPVTIIVNVLTER